MNKRIREVREYLGLTRKAFGEQLGLSADMVNNLERGRVEPKENVNKLICTLFNVNSEWLESGTGEMFRTVTRDEEIAAFIGEVLSEEEDTFKKRLISVLAKLNVDEWEFLAKIAKELAESSENDTI